MPKFFGCLLADLLVISSTKLFVWIYIFDNLGRVTATVNGTSSYAKKLSLVEDEIYGLKELYLLVRPHTSLSNEQTNPQSNHAAISICLPVAASGYCWAGRLMLPRLQTPPQQQKPSKLTPHSALA